MTNALVQEIARIGSSAKERRIHQRTLIDGPHLVQMFSARGGSADVLVASESGMRNPEVASLFEQCRADRRVIFSDRVFERVSPVESPVGLLAIIAIPAPASPKEPWTDGVLLDAIQDAGSSTASFKPLVDEMPKVAFGPVNEPYSPISISSPFPLLHPEIEIIAATVKVSILKKNFFM